MISVEVSDFSDFDGLLTHLQTVRPLLAGGKAARNLLLDRLRYYPSRNSSYVRTYKLRRGWEVDVAGWDRSLSGGGRLRSLVSGRIASGQQELKITLTNPVAYGPWVMGDRTQAAIHRGIWQTTGMILQVSSAEILRLFERSIEAELDQ